MVRITLNASSAQASSMATMPRRLVAKRPEARSCRTTSLVAAGSVAAEIPPSISARTSGTPKAQSPHATKTTEVTTTVSEMVTIARPCVRRMSRFSTPPSRNATIVSAVEA